MPFHQSPVWLFKPAISIYGSLAGRRHLWLMLLLGFSLCGYSQRLEKAKVDSLIRLLSHAVSDTQRARMKNEVAFAYFAVDPRTGIQYGQQALALAQQLHLDKQIAASYNALGANYWAMSDFIRSQDYYLKALKINEQRGDSG